MSDRRTMDRETAMGDCLRVSDDTPNLDELWYLRDAPERWFVCDHCQGEGVISRSIIVYERGCGFPHDDAVDETCKECRGVGGWIVDAAQQKDDNCAKSDPHK